MPDPRDIPLGLYVHWPWCVRKCPYCDFNSHPVRGAVDETGYVRALLADLDLDLPLAGGRPLSSLFIGGGTPSLLSGRAVGDLLDGVRERLEMTPGAEVTLEANPGASEAARFSLYREAGVNRLSIGAQSFDPSCLEALGRIHGAEDIPRAVDAARRAGFENLNLDLMFGLPGQSLERGLEDLRAALALQPEHLSYYQLTLEPNTAFERFPPVLPDEDVIDSLHERGQALLEAAGYEPYEVSAFARRGARCAHNLSYWSFGDYLGIGAGAHAKLTLPDGTVDRRWRQRDPRRFQAGAGTHRALAGTHTLDAGDLISEFALNALRMHQGFSGRLFEARTGLSFDAMGAPVSGARARGLLEVTGGRCRATPLGRRFLNDLIGLFLSPLAEPAGARSAPG